MRRFLLQMTLLFVFGGWWTSAHAAWDFTQNALTKPTELQDGKYYYFRNACNPNALTKVWGADMSYSASDLNSNHVFLVVFGGKNAVTNEQIAYLQSYNTKKWFADGKFTADSQDEATPLTLGYASKTTFPEFVEDNMPESIRGTRVTMPEWIAAGGDESLTDPEIFPSNSSYIKEPAWKWRSYEYEKEGGDAITLLYYTNKYTTADVDREEVYGLYNIWGGYSTVDWGTGKTALNPWYAYEAVYVDDVIGDLETLLQEYKDDNLAYKYKEGTSPGCLVDQSFYTKYIAKYQEATDFVEGMDLSEEKAAALIEELKAAREALFAAPRVELTEGFYYIHSAMWEYAQKQQFTVPGEEGGEDIVVGKVKAMYDRESNILAWNDWYKEVTIDGKKQIVSKADDAAYIYRITKSEQDPALWDIQNALTGRFLSGAAKQTVAMATTPHQIVKVAAPNDGAYGIRAQGGGSYDYYHTGGHSSGAGTSGNLTGWSLGTSGGSTWSFVRVDDQKLIDSLATAMDQKILDNRLTAEIASAEATMAPGYLSLITSADQITSNAPDPSEGTDYGALIDNNTGTFFHSSWHTSVDPQDYHYLEFKLPEALDKVAVDWYKRTSNHANRPAKIVVKGLKEGSDTWADAAILPAEGDTLPWGSGTPGYTKEVALAGGPYTALRFVVTETRMANGVLCAKDSVNGTLGGYPNFTFSEFHLYNGLNADGTFQYRANSLAYREDVKPAYEALQKAVAAAKAVLGQATEKDIEALQAAIKVFDAAYPDTAILDDVISKAEAFYEQAVSSGGDETLLGAYNTESVHEALNTAVEDAKKEYNKETVTRAYIDKHTAAIQQAIDNFVADVNMPKMDTWYFIENRYNGEDRNEDTNPYANLVYASGKGVGAGLKWGGDVNTGNEDATYLWRFIDMGNNTFAVQNFGTGYYMGANRGTSAQYLLSDTAVAFKFAYVAGEQLTLEDANYNPEQKSLRYIHADGSHNVVTWSAAQDSPSSWMFVEVSEDDFIPMMKVTPNGMDIITLPFNVATTGSLDDVITTDPISVYTLASATTNSEGLITEVTLNPIEVGVTGIPAGTPFIAAYPEELVDEEHAGIKLNVDLSMALSTDAKTVNGLVGVLRADTAQVGMGYFEGDTHEITSVTKKPVSISVQSGYINPKLIVNEEAKDGSVVIGIKDGGVLDNIQAAIKDANTLVDVVDMSGVVVRRSVKKADALKGLAKGVYVVGGTKVSVK